MLRYEHVPQNFQNMAIFRTALVLAKDMKPCLLGCVDWGCWLSARPNLIY